MKIASKICRAKCIDTGAWIQGCYVHLTDPLKTKESHRIYLQTARVREDGELDPIWFEIDTTTLIAYAGFPDKKNNPLFEGDIVKDDDGKIYTVIRTATEFCLRYDPPEAHGYSYVTKPLSDYWHAHGAIIEKIGSIHDENPPK